MSVPERVPRFFKREGGYLLVTRHKEGRDASLRYLLAVLSAFDVNVQRLSELDPRSRPTPSASLKRDDCDMVERPPGLQMVRR